MKRLHQIRCSLVSQHNDGQFMHHIFIEQVMIEGFSSTQDFSTFDGVRRSAKTWSPKEYSSKKVMVSGWWSSAGVICYKFMRSA